MVRRKYIIKAKVEDFIKCISSLVNQTCDFSSSIKVHANNMKADGKSIINIMALGIVENTAVEFVANGDDEHEALQKIHEILQRYEVI
ncbi:HPr family phosphocarrier protein [Ureaplasma miroungigenitalium]|uniref:HPr family phosphocarrier protein n=1 Tax=Ureaplasma miroungigenitalium TaxID=1042321 RepID=A0ABT3BNC4_9BACT|nr:HPr family phosphocarrier protein [Ureaplasma miroungigenitalium]MCV3728710.1 HPr family phosphocarrier protein [Ureaplasma miroungigenitalium]MCV3734474.1 HPr family phosphocarrier protein [Ureaplasma miroungigenitalium]